MPDRTVVFGESQTAARYQTQDTDPAGGDFTLVEDLDNAIQALLYSYSQQRIVANVPVDVSQLYFNDTVEAPQAIDPATGTVDIDVGASNWHDPVAATENIDITFSNVSSGGKFLLIHLTDGDGGGPYTISSWPASVVWNGGTVVDEIPANGSVEVFFVSPDGGTTWRARAGGEF